MTERNGGLYPKLETPQLHSTC